MPRPPARPKPPAPAGPSNDARLRAASNISGNRGFAAGFPNFHFSAANGGVSGHVFLHSGTTQWLDVRADFLGYPTVSGLPKLFSAAHWFAVRNRFPTGLPTGHQASYLGIGQVFGVSLLRPGKVVIREVIINEIGTPSYSDVPAMFRGVADYAHRNGFVGGFPTFAISGSGRGTRHFIALFTAANATWADVPQSEVLANL